MKYQNTVLYFYSIFFINGFCNISHETRPAMQAGLAEHLGTVGMSPHLLLTLFQSGEQTKPNTKACAQLDLKMFHWAWSMISSLYRMYMT